MRRISIPFGIGVLALSIFTCSADADIVVLRNGDVIHCTVIKRTFEEVIIDHPDLGRVSLPASIVVSITIEDDADQTEQQPAVPEGPAEPEPEQAAPPGEPVVSPQGPERPPESAPDEEDAETQDEIRSLLEVKQEDPWRISFVLGGSLTNDDDGEKLSVNTRFHATHLIPSSETTFDINYLLKFEQSEITDNRFTAIADQAWLNTKDPWLYFARARYDFDEFRSWEQRAQLHGGVGYRLITDEEFRLSGRIGVGGRKDFGSIDEAFRAEGWLGAYLDWRQVDRQRLSLGVTYYPVLGDTDYRIVTAADWSFVLSRFTHLSFNTNLEWEYATDPDPGFPPNTIRLTFGLQFNM